MFLEISAKSQKSICELLPNKVSVSRPKTNNRFLQKNVSEIKPKVSYLAL